MEDRAGVIPVMGGGEFTVSGLLYVLKVVGDFNRQTKEDAAAAIESGSDEMEDGSFSCDLVDVRQEREGRVK